MEDKLQNKKSGSENATPHEITDFDLQALIDDELNENRRIFVLDRLQNDYSLQKRYEELIYQKEVLLMWWKASDRNT